MNMQHFFVYFVIFLAAYAVVYYILFYDKCYYANIHLLTNAMFAFLLLIGCVTKAAQATDFSNGSAIKAFQETVQNSVQALVILSPPHTLKCTSYDFAWKAPTHSTAKRYFIRYKQASVGSNASEAANAWKYVTVFGNTTQYSINNLSEQSIYHVEIVSQMQNLALSRPAMSSFRTGCQTSAGSVEMNVNSLPPLVGQNHPEIENQEVLDAPSLSTKVISKTALSLMWQVETNKKYDIREFKIEMKVNGKGRSWRNKVSQISSDTRSHNVTGLKKGLGYRFRVITEYENGKSTTSNSVKFFTTHESVQPPLIAPQMLYVDVRNVSQLCIKVENLGRNSDTEGYFVKLVKNNVGQKSKLAAIHGDLICILSTFKIEIPYSFKIQSYNVHGRSPYSDDIFFKIPVGYKRKTYIILNLPVFTVDPDIPVSTVRSHNEVQVAPYSPLGSMSQRDIAILIAGLAMVLVVIVLVISAIIYNRMKIHEKSGFDARMSTHHSILPASAKDAKECGHPKSRHYDEICHQSLNGSSQQGYLDADIHHCGSRTAPLWWVRGLDGEFCHIVPKDSTRSISQVPSTDITNVTNSEICISSQQPQNCNDAPVAD